MDVENGLCSPDAVVTVRRRCNVEQCTVMTRKDHKVVESSSLTEVER